MFEKKFEIGFPEAIGAEKQILDLEQMSKDNFNS